MRFLFNRIATASVLLSIAPNITKADASIPISTELYCKGCYYFAVFDKVKKDYQLNYITPKQPDMKEVIDKKQEVIWVNAKGDYTPYFGKKGDGHKVFCGIGTYSSNSYECKSALWSNHALGDAVGSLGIIPATSILFSLGTGYGYYKEINANLLTQLKAVLDASDISACGLSLTDKLFVNNFVKLTVQDLQSPNFSYDQNMESTLIYKNNGFDNCINLENYRLQQKGLGQNKKTFLFSKSEPNKVTVFSGEIVGNVDLNTLNDIELFNFNYNLDPDFSLDALVKIGQQAFLSDMNRVVLSNLNSYITKEVQNFLTVPLVPEPSLPPTPTLVKGEFEKETQFKERVLLEINKREAQVTALQAEYRSKVEARNKEAEKRLQLKDKYADFITKRYFKKMMGGVSLQNPQYDSEKEIMYVDMVSTNSDFTRPLAIHIPLANDEAKEIKEQINEQSLDVKALFSVDKSTIVLNEVKILSNGKSYIAEVQADKFVPQTVKVILPETQAQLDAIYQNPNLADLIKVPKLSFANSAFNGGIQFTDDVADGVKQLASTPTDTKKWLFLVAIEDYKETDKVVFAKHSADLIATTLKKRLGISDRNSYVLIDTDATAGAIKDKLAQMITNIQPDDTIYFYYSGHGVPDPVSAESYILPRDKVVDFVVKEPEFQLGNIYRTLSQSSAGKVIVFVDSCFSGRTDNMSVIKGTAPGLIRVKEMDIQEPNMAVITAGKNTQFSNAYDAKGHRMFSYFLIRSLLKERNAPLDINTIFQEVSVGVRDESNAKGDIYKQEPQFYGNSSLQL